MICEEGLSKANTLVSILAIFGFGLGVLCCVGNRLLEYCLQEKDVYESSESEKKQSSTKSETESDQIEPYEPLSKKSETGK